MRNVIIWFMEAKCVVGKVQPPEVIGLTLPQNTFAVFTFRVNYEVN